MNEELAAHGITYQQWQALAVIALAGGELTQCELAERLKIEPPTLAGIVDRMEKAGWVRRITDPLDRRRKVVRPTPAVEPVWKRMTACARKVRARAFRGLSAAALRQARKVLSNILDNLSSQGAPREKAT